MRNYEGSLNKSIYDPPPRPSVPARSLKEFRKRTRNVLQPAGAAGQEDSSVLREAVQGHVDEWKRLRRKRRTG